MPLKTQGLDVFIFGVTSFKMQFRVISTSNFPKETTTQRNDIYV